MTPEATARLRRLTGLFTALWAGGAILLAIFALVWPHGDLTLPVHCSFIGGRATVEWTTPEARVAGVVPGDRLISVDGTSIYDVLRMGTYSLHEDVANRYEFASSTSDKTIVVDLLPAPAQFDRKPSYAVVHLALLVVSAAFLAIGSIVWWNKPERAEGWAMMLFCSMMAIELATSIRVHLQPLTSTRLLANLPLLGAATFHLFTTYPVEPEWIVRHRRIRIVPYVIAFGLMGAIGLERAMAEAGWVGEVAFFYGLVLSLCSIAIPMFERSRAHLAGIGDRVDMMIMAASVSLLPGLCLLLVDYFVRAPLPWYIGLLWVVIFPVVVGYGMLRKQLFEFRLVARSSAAYGAATLAITGLFAFLITFADALVSLFGVTVRSVQVAFLFVAILAFDPLRDRLQRLVDQLFDRDRSRYREAVREISEAMVSMLSLKEISDRILLAITDTMGVGRAMVLLFDEGDRVLRPSSRRGDWEEVESEIEIPSEHPIWRHLWMRREELSRSDFDELTDAESREECWEVYDALEVELLVPILFGVDLLGVIAVGRRLNGERLGLDDRQLMRTLANQSAIAIENGKAFDEIAKLNETLEARVEERTRELEDTQAQLLQSEKLKSLGQLVAGVAHELNNPIGFVHANLQLLDEYVQKLIDGQGAAPSPENDAQTARIREAITKLLSRSREGTERVKEIVQDLRTFSRMDQAELQSANLHEEIDRTVALMEPRLKNKIEVVREYGELPSVRCYPGQLNQVFLNLLMNACDALEDGGTITIRSHALEDDAGVRLSFTDDGPGIPPDVVTRIFDPFFTTKPVGVGTGLGLSLSHGIIERHGGRFTVHSAENEGTTFSIELPLDAPPPDE